MPYNFVAHDFHTHTHTLLRLRRYGRKSIKLVFLKELGQFGQKFQVGSSQPTILI